MKEDWFEKLLDKQQLQLEHFLTIFLKKYFKDFIQHIQEASQKDICQLQQSFSKNWGPVYSNKLHRSFYFIKYAVPYCIEYREIYLNILDSRDFSNSTSISVLSIGCGAMLDFVGFIYALRKIDKHISWSYHGIDIIDWECKDISKLSNENIKFTCKSIGDISLEDFNNHYDIIIFPKSISDIPSKELNTFISSIPQRILPDTIILVLSKRGRSTTDNEYMDKICESIKSEYLYDTLEKASILGEGCIEVGKIKKAFTDFLPLKFSKKIEKIQSEIYLYLKDITNREQCGIECKETCSFNSYLMKNIASKPYLYDISPEYYPQTPTVNAEPVIYCLKRNGN